jgi:2-methylisocitrate lyase-like PEP mutase family enzyme
MTEFPTWIKALQDAGAANIFAELGSQNKEIRQHVDQILGKLNASEERNDADRS